MLFMCRQVLHWAQWFNEPEPHLFAFNYGPDYDLTAIRTPIHLFSAGVDVLAPPKDIALTRAKLTSAGVLTTDHHTPDYSHMDYIWDLGAKDGVYKKVLEVLLKGASSQ